MKESSRKKNRKKNDERNTLTRNGEQPSTEAEVEFEFDDQYGAFIEF